MEHRLLHLELWASVSGAWASLCLEYQLELVKRLRSFEI